MKTKQQLTRDYQYLFEMADQLLLAYQNDIFDEEIEDLTKCLEELSGNTLKERWKEPNWGYSKAYKLIKTIEKNGCRMSEEITNGKNTN